MKYWLIKSEPETYPFSKLKEENQTFWDGVRNYQARNNLRDMTIGDLCLFYHSNEGKEIVGLAKVVREAYQDPTTDDQAWLVVDVAFEKEFKNPVSLVEIKKVPELQNMVLVKNSRLSVQPVMEEEFGSILRLSESEK